MDKQTVVIKAARRARERIREDLEPWVVLVIDDEPGVLDVTKNVLKTFIFKGRSLQLETARSCEAAKELYMKFPQAAIAIVDCMMEKNTSGLEFIKFVREEKKNTLIQLVLRTGQPNFAPERRILLDYDINDYLAKTELLTRDY